MIDGATILVADDSSDDIELLKRAIHKAGLHNPVEVVSDGEELIDHLKETESHSASGASCPLLLFLDLNLPRRSGFEVLEWLRQEPHLEGLPIIIFSNSDLPSDIDRSFELGAHGYLVKPSRFEDWVEMMVRLKEMIGHVARNLRPEELETVSA
jgi:CheY-like chemotaxis protein